MRFFALQNQNAYSAITTSAPCTSILYRVSFAVSVIISLMVGKVSLVYSIGLERNVIVIVGAAVQVAAKGIVGARQVFGDKGMAVVHAAGQFVKRRPKIVEVIKLTKAFSATLPPIVQLPRLLGSGG